MKDNFKVAIIGANGYIGKHLEYFFKKMGVTPMCYDIHDNKRNNYQQLDMRDVESIKKIDFNVDYIFMFAGITGTYNGFDKYNSFIDINEIGLLNLLNSIRHSIYRPKIIFPSTRLVYKGQDKALCEDDLKETKTIYAINKLACESILYAYWQSFDIPYTIFRICIPYGNLLSNDYSYGTIGFFIKQAISGNNITLYGGGDIKRTFTHIEDLCFQIIEGAIKEESCGQIFNIGGQTLTLKEAAEIIASKFKTKVLAIEWPESDFKIESGHTYFDDSKIRALLKIGEDKQLEDFSNDI